LQQFHAVAKGVDKGKTRSAGYYRLFHKFYAIYLQLLSCCRNIGNFYRNMPYGTRQGRLYAYMQLQVTDIKPISLRTRKDGRAGKSAPALLHRYRIIALLPAFQAVRKRENGPVV
jgi:hypothetical protein